MKRAAALLATTFAVTTLAGAGAAFADYGSCVAGLRSQLVASGIDPALVNAALNQSGPDEKVLRLSKVQPEFRTPIWDYLGFLVDDQRVEEGRQMMRRHAAALAAAEKRFGVDRYYIAGVWGVETDFGRETGSSYLPHALATLVCEGGKRKDFWRAELTAALRLVQRGDLQLNELYGSWAGAFGQTQFIPSTYQRLAVDMDGDGRRDLVKSVADALGSTANYLRASGWRTGEPVMHEVILPPGYSGPVGRTRRVPASRYAALGVKRADGRPLPGDLPAGLLLPAGREGPAFLVYKNFDAIYAYNRAESYALAISYLAQRLAGGPRIAGTWPTDDPGLSRAQRRRLQELLVARGFDIGGAPDGKIGPATRAAIARVERQLGMPETGRAGMKVYRALGGQ